MSGAPMKTQVTKTGWTCHTNGMILRFADLSSEALSRSFNFLGLTRKKSDRNNRKVRIEVLVKIIELED